jgi:glycosyltransferase involved in cell wall biosynthesis
LKTNITYIVSNINKALAFEWISSYLNKNKYNLNFILLNSEKSDLEEYLIQNKIPVKRINYSSKKDFISAIFDCYKILKKHKTSIVHTHLVNANIIGLTAAWLARVPKRIQTRHHSNYHHLYFPKAVKYDKFANKLSTDIVAISEVVKEVLLRLENVPENKIHLIHHGFLLDEFINVSESSHLKIQEKYNPNKSSPVIGVISRYIELKGIQYIIPAFVKLIQTYPDALLILANSTGSYKEEIKKQLEILPKKNYVEIPFETDIFSLYKIFDIFIHTPVGTNVEAFGQTYVEALAAEVPSIFTLSGIANEFIKNNHNALVVPFKNSEEILDSINILLSDRNLVTKLVSNGKNDVHSMFGLKKMILSLETLYQNNQL